MSSLQSISVNTGAGSNPETAFLAMLILILVILNNIGQRDQTPRLNYLIFFISRLVSVHYLCQGKSINNKSRGYSPESQQVWSLDKEVGGFTIYGYGGHLGHVTLKPYLQLQNSSCLDCVSSCQTILFHLKKSSYKVRVLK